MNRLSLTKLQKDQQQMQREMIPPYDGIMLDQHSVEKAEWLKRCIA